MKTRSVYLAALLLSLMVTSSRPAFGQGSLTPPGPPGPTMKTLDQIGVGTDVRTAVDATNTPGDATNTFIIRTPGSYYFTANVTGVAGTNGISIQSDDATLDLNGYALLAGGGGAFRGINVPAAQKGLTIRNGTVQGWTGGGVRTDLATSTLVQHLRLIDNSGAIGLFLGNGAANECVASGNLTGIAMGNGAVLTNCAASGNTTGFSSGDRCSFSNCISTSNTGNGFNCSSYVSLLDCNATLNNNNGILVVGNATISRCVSSKNKFSGIAAGNGSTVVSCTAAGNLVNGILVGIASTVQNCTAQGNSNAGVECATSCQVLGNTCDTANYGVSVTANGNRIDGNSCTANIFDGYRLLGSNNIVVRNSAHANGVNYLIPATNATGQISDLTSGGTITSAASAWANFTYVG